MDEICNYGPDTLEGQVISALTATGDLFLRTGHPAAETLALLALKARAWSAIRLEPATLLVLEDRGPATVAACQATVLHPSGTPADLLRTARMILAAAAWSRPLPDLSLLITDDPAVCEQRLTARTGHPVTADMRAFTRQALAVYEMLAQDDPARWTVISRARLSTDQVPCRDDRRLRRRGPRAGAVLCVTSPCCGHCVPPVRSPARTAISAQSRTIRTARPGRPVSCRTCPAPTCPQRP